MSKKIIIIISCIFIIIVGNLGIHFYNKIELKNSDYYINFKNVKKDFELVNEKVLESKDKNLQFSFYSNEVDSKTKKSIENIMRYAKENLCDTDEYFVREENGMIIYLWNANGTTYIVYTTNKKDLKEQFKKMPIYQLDENWYYVHEHHI